MVTNGLVYGAYPAGYALYTLLGARAYLLSKVPF